MALWAGRADGFLGLPEWHAQRHLVYCGDVTNGRHPFLGGNNHIRSHDTFAFKVCIQLTDINFWYNSNHRNQNSKVGIVTFLLQVGESKVWFWQRQEIFLFFKMSRPAVGSTQHPVSGVLEVLSIGVKWPECVVYCSPISNAEINEWSYASVSPICLCGMDRDDCSFTFKWPSRKH